MSQHIFPDVTTEKAPVKSLQGRLRPGEKFIEGGIVIAGVLAIVVLLGVFILLLKEGLPIFVNTSPWEFFFGAKWYPVSDPPSFGTLPFFVATLMVTVLATAIAVPIGVACAAYLAEIAPVKVR